MPDTGSITSANSVFTITVPGLFDAPVQLQGYSAEKAWSSDQQGLTESQIGVDGRKTAGYVFNQVRQTVALQADSPSKAIFKAIVQAMQSTRDVYYLQCDISLPSTGEAFTGLQGTIEDWKAIPDAGRVLQPMDFVIAWGSLQPTLL
jgi:hypothetical protein